MKKSAMLLFIAAYALHSWAAAPPQEYLVGPGDLIKISVAELDDVEDNYRIDSQGHLSLPYLGRIDVQDKSLQDLTTTLTTAFEKYVNEPHVFVEIVEFNYRPISVIGAVKEPGKLDRSGGNLKLVEALTLAGGLSDNAGDRIIILRKTPWQVDETLEISYREMMELGQAHFNIPLYPGDTINVPVAQPLVVSVIGEVNRPGEYKFSANTKVTFLRVIAAAGGFTDYAKRQRIVIKRQQNGQANDIEVNAKDIQANRAVDLSMAHNDVVIVP